MRDDVEVRLLVGRDVLLLILDAPDLLLWPLQPQPQPPFFFACDMFCLL